jgi:hypothetical protein
MTSEAGRRIDVPAGRADVLHRLALAVQPRDAVTAGPLPAGIRVGLETPRARTHPRRGRPPFPAVPLEGAAVFVLRHGHRERKTVTLRVDDPARRWLPRRFTVPLWTVREVEEVDANPGRPGGPIPAESRLLRPWLLPGPAFAVVKGATGLRLRVTRESVPVRWARVEAFGAGGHRIGWAHGDEHGEALLLISGTGAVPPPAPARFDVALRFHVPARRAEPDPADPLADLALERVTRSSAPPVAGDLDNDLLRGITAPPGYLTADQDVVTALTIGEVTPFGYDVPSPPQP